MNYRKLGNTGLMVSEIGLGGEWLENQDTESVVKIIRKCEEYGINIVDCWMSEPNVRSNIGTGIHANRDKWIVQGQIGSARVNGQHMRTRDMNIVPAAFQDLLTRMQTDYMDIGMIHFVDSEREFTEMLNSPFMEYVLKLKRDGVIRHIGMSTHNPIVGQMAAKSGIIEMMLFSINPAFDLLPPSEDINDLFAEEYAEGLHRADPKRMEFYSLCEQLGVGITVMKGFAGGRLFDAKRSPFGVALTPIQCLHYALTRPAVASVLVGYSNVQQVTECVAYETASDEEKDYTRVLTSAPKHTYVGQCTYCGHCAPCPQKIDIATVNKYADLALMQSSVPASLKEHYRALSANASDCIACHACETRCPFGVKIAEKMAATKKLFS